MANNLIKLSHYGIIKISGAAAASFLQGQFTCDIKEITPTTFRLTAYCNSQGRIGCVGRLWLHAEDYFLLIPLEIMHEIITDLRKYAMFSKVTVEALDNYACLVVIHDMPVTTFCSDITLPPTPLSVSAHDELILLNLGDYRWLLVAPSLFIEKLSVALNTNGYPLAHPELWDLTEIRAGIPIIHQATMNQLLPHDVNLPELQAVSFNKGCYKGQEIIARMQYRGQRKKHLYYAACNLAEPVSPGSIITDASGKNVGELVCMAPSPQGGYELLAVITDTAALNELPLTLNGCFLNTIRLPHYIKR